MAVSDRLGAMLARYREISRAMEDPDVWSDPERSAALSKEEADLAPVVRASERVSALEKEIEGAREIAQGGDEELRSLARGELASLEEDLSTAQEGLRRLLIPKDPRDDKDVIMEIRAGAGGDEAALFAADLYRMYGRLAERRGWTLELLEASETDIGGFKEIVVGLKGRGVYAALKFESGVHRVQRVPNTEAQGRIHTSTATVAVLPEAEEVEVDIAPEDLRIDTYRASGAGGQHINKTESAVRITHLPTGLVVACQDERSQHKNREKAMRVLRARLYDLMHQAAESEMAENRRKQVGTGDRSERIRTYNFPQGRVTDHRIGFTTHQLMAILDGDMGELIDALHEASEREQLESAP